MGTYRKHSTEYKAHALDLIRKEGWSVAEVAAASDVSLSAVRLWMKKQKETLPPEEELTDAARIRELEKENKRLRMERDFAKKVAAWFAKEENQ